MTFAPRPYLQRVSLDTDLDIDFRQWPFSIPAIRELGEMTFHPDVTFFVGENGSGKSTLMEAIALAMGFGPEGGTKNVHFATAQTTSDLHQSISIAKSFKAPRDGYFLRAESFFNVASEIDRLDEDPTAGPRINEGYGNKSLHARSHGEAFMALLTLKLRGKGLYIFDEPEAALSPSRQLAALSAIHQLVQDESQFIIATHSPILLAYPHARIYQFDASGVYETCFEETEHYAVTKDFLNHYPRRLEQLLAEDQDEA